MRLTHALRLAESTFSGEREIIAIVGGGGKTTAMFRLAGELAADGRRVITTTTTRIFAAQTRLAPAHIVVTPNDLPMAEAQLLDALDRHRQALVTGPVHPTEGKAFGVAPDLIPRLFALPGVGAVIVEADGSRMRPLKAPAAHEPVIPAQTTLVVPVAGADVLGRSLNDEHVHRAGRLAELVSLPLGRSVTPSVVAAALTHPGGGLKNAPPGARVCLLINKVEEADRLAGAREIAVLALQVPAVDSVVLGQVAAADPVREAWGRTAMVILAAGAARRMGRLKQLLEWRGRTLVEHALDTALAANAHEVLLVVGAEAERVAGVVGNRPVRVVHNPDWESGQSTSVRAGLAALGANAEAGPDGPFGAAGVSSSPARAEAGPDGPFGAALFLLADQPTVPVELLAALIQRHRETLAPVVAPRVGGRRANPVLFDRATWPELRAVRGDLGGRAVVDREPGRVEWVDWSEDILADVDTPDDYAALQRAEG